MAAAPGPGAHPLRRWRDREGCSARAAANAAATSAATVSRIETGRQYPRPELLSRLVELTGGMVSADAFLGWRIRGGDDG